MNIRQIQHLLAYLGYDPGPVDGLDGPNTQNAVTAFQKKFGGLEATGQAGEDTRKALRHAVAYGMPSSEKIATPSCGTVRNDQGSGTVHSGKTGTFWDEIEYFTRAEFGCRCKEYNGPYCDGFPVEPNETLVRLADRVRKHFGRPAYRSSGIRCRQHNADSGGVSNSLHLEGKALDFYVEGVSGEALLAYIQAQPETNYAYIIGGQMVHMDVR